ncbi:MAG: PAS domain-containing sensor histidine kinase, partial [Tateyamaria sp.]
MTGAGDLWASLPVPVIIIGARDEIVDINSAAEGFFNSSVKTMKGLPLWDELAVDAPLGNSLFRARKEGTPLFCNDVDVGHGGAGPPPKGFPIAPVVRATGHNGLRVSRRQADAGGGQRQFW